jgi:hypothetical protein
MWLSKTSRFKVYSLLNLIFFHLTLLSSKYIENEASNSILAFLKSATCNKTFLGEHLKVSIDNTHYQNQESSFQIISPLEPRFLPFTLLAPKYRNEARHSILAVSKRATCNKTSLEGYIASELQTTLTTPRRHFQVYFLLNQDSWHLSVQKFSGVSQK